MILIIIYWIFLFLVIYGIGRLLLEKKLLRIFRFDGEINWFEYFWVGFLGVTVILQVWSVFLPVNYYTLIFVAAVSTLSYIFQIPNGYKFLHINSFSKFAKTNFVFVLISILVLVTISFYASQVVTWPDTLLYHLSAVKWSNTFAVVPGLANLHSRLGFNSSFFLFASMIDSFYFKNASVHVALSLLVSVVLLEIVWILLKKFNLSIKLFCLFIAVFMIREVATSGAVSSFSTDFALAMVVVATSIEFLMNDIKALFIAVAMAALALTVKLSGLTFFATVFLFVLFELIKRVKRGKIKAVWVVLLSGGILLIPYIVRNVILSGWPFFPIPVFGVSTPWALARSTAASTSSLIHAWAINPGANWPKFREAPFLLWIPIWFGRYSDSPEIKMFFLSCALFLILPVVRILKRASIGIIRPPFLLATAALLSTIYVLLAAPDIRFGVIFVWVFFATAIIPFLVFVFSKKRKFTILIVIAGIYFLNIIWQPIKFPGKHGLFTVMKELPHPTKEVLVNESDLKNQFYILKPTEGNRCGNSDLLCTPELNDIRELVPGDISKGFAPVN